jgi:predicted transcriptional regulator
VPNQPATPGRSVRVPDELWEAVQEIAADREETVTDVILRALRRYVRLYGEESAAADRPHP